MLITLPGKPKTKVKVFVNTFLYKIGVWLVERTAEEICFTMANSINVILTGKRVKPDVLTNDPSDKMELHKEKVKFRKKSK